MRIGRGSECEARINHRSVSRHHASIEYRGDAFYVVDAGSANGITVNGERYAETPYEVATESTSDMSWFASSRPGKSPSLQIC